jgi:MFS family permease
VFRLALTLFLLQSGFHAYTASLPVALAGAGVSDPRIGLIVGSAGMAQIPATFLVGMLLDRLGGMLLVHAGAAAYLVGSLLLLAPGVDPSASTLTFAARIFQGIGYAAALPSALSLIPRLVLPDRRGFGLALVGSADNLTILALPPLSLALLAMFTLRGVALATMGVVVLGVLLGRGLRPLPRVTSAPTSSRFGFRIRRVWLGPLAVVLLFMVHWGVLSAYLPPRAERAGADIGAFFVCDGVAVLLARPVVGWLTDRFGSHWLVLTGLALTLAGVVIAMLPATTFSMLGAGLFTGLGGAAAITPILVELSQRSDDTDRGSAFSLFSAAMAGGLVLGSAGSAPIVAIWGFEGAALVAIGGLCLPAIFMLRSMTGTIAPV